MTSIEEIDLNMGGVGLSDIVFQLQELNTALSSVLFDGRYAGKPLYLDIEDEQLQEAGALLGISGAEFAQQAAAATGAVLASADRREALYRYALDARRWLRTASDKPPPFVLMLAVLSMAANEMQGDAEFSANNYYERLFALTGISDAAEKSRVRRAFQVTRYLWEALNEWLRRHDGALGYPTASPVIPNWKYAGYPVSQALVRKAERQRLERMFETYGLTPGEAVQPDEMLDYLAEWIPSPDSGSQFKRLWARQELRLKIAHTASLELASWAGSDRATSHTGNRQNVTAYLQFGGWLTEEVHILLGISAGSAERAVDEANELTFSASPSPFEGVDFLMPHGPLPVSKVLAAGFSAAAKEDQRLVRRGRPIIPFVSASNGPGFREASRVSLITEHAVLCHVLWTKQVETHFQNYALPGWVKQGSASLAGLPEDWVIFRNVEFLNAPEATVPNSLQCLVPLADSSLKMEKGLHLSNDDWHADAGITLQGTAAGRRLSIKIFDPLSQSDTPIVAGADLPRTGWLEASRESGLKAGNFEARLYADGKPVRTMRFGLRSASRPRPSWSLEGIPEVFYTSSSTAPQAAFGSSSQEGTGRVQGMKVLGNAAFSGLPDTLEIIPNSAAAGPERSEAAGLNASLAAAAGLEKTCALRGHHVWTCQPFNKGDEARDPKWQTCDGCGTTIVVKNRGRIARATKKRRSVKSHHSKPQIKTPLPPQRPAPKPEDKCFSPNLLLDGLFYLGGGRGSRLSKVAAQAGSSAWDGTEFIKNMIALGHIDVEPVGFSDQPQFWKGSPAVLCDTGSGHGFLSGFRSADMIKSIIKTAAEMGIEVSSAAQDLAPDAVFLTAKSSADLHEFTRQFTGHSNIRLHYQLQPGASLAAMFPSAEALLSALPASLPGTTLALERFDPASAGWSAASELLPGQAYRTTAYIRQYYYMHTDGRSVLAPYTLAKTWAAKANGAWLHAYTSGEFSVALGCRPPALLERALVSCSGLLPQRRAGRLVYQGVEKRVAELVLARLYA